MKLWHFSLLCLLALNACGEKAPTTSTGEAFTLSTAQFTELTNWEQDDHSGALTAFLSSCGAWKNKPTDSTIGCGDLALNVKHWQNICTQAAQIDNAESNDIRNFFEANFRPFNVAANGKNEGLFTGYYIPEIQGSRTRGGPYQTPIYGVPGDLEKGKPYHTRAEVYAGKLKERSLEIAWTDDPIALFFLEIQGSGVMRLREGGFLTIGFAGKNNQDYVALGHVMEEKGMLEPGNVNLFTIKEWLYNNPDKAQRVMEENPRYIFLPPITGQSHTRCTECSINSPAKLSGRFTIHSVWCAYLLANNPTQNIVRPKQTIQPTDGCPRHWRRH